MHNCTSVCGKTLSIASGNPFSPSTQAMKMSVTPRFFHVVDLFQVLLDLAGREPPRIQRNDVRVKAGEACLMLLDDLRLKGPVSIPRHFDGHRPEAPLERLPRLAIARVTTLIAGRVMLLVTDMLG